MSHEIEFSVMQGSAVGVRELLDQFEAESGIHVRLRLLDWDSAWSDLMKAALYSDGPDISEIGTTWLGDLSAMNALYALGEKELAALGRGANFLPSAWQSTHLVYRTESWAVPWVTGARLIFYRRNLLEKAGVNERLAFQSAAMVNETLKTLQEKGIRVPWTVPTGTTHTTLHDIASWVWGQRGDFVTADGKRTLFSKPEARNGMRAYFSLRRYLAPGVERLNGLEPDAEFINDPEAAVTITGTWLFNQAAPKLGKDLGVALPPGPSFVGGSHLIIWKHSTKHQEAFKLIQFLTQPQAQVQHSQSIGLMPARLDTLISPPFSTQPLWQLAATALRSGRSFPVARSWGLMEDRLTSVFASLWNDILENPDLDLDVALVKRLEPLAQRLDLVLGQS
ncbi:MAG: extracellular solute-binding protein [Anaerolineae bacterium]